MMLAGVLAGWVHARQMSAWSVECGTALDRSRSTITTMGAHTATVTVSRTRGIKVAGRVYQSKSGEYDLWIPESPEYPEPEQFARFKEFRLSVNQLNPPQCALCLAIMHHWDNPALSRGRRDGVDTVSAPSITLGCKVQRLELSEIRSEGRVRPLHMMTWTVIPMLFKAQGCPGCQRLMLISSNTAPAGPREYRPMRRAKQRPLTRKVTGLNSSVLSAPLPVGTGLTWTTERETRERAYIDVTSEVKSAYPPAFTGQ